MELQLPEKVHTIITSLEAHGFEAYAVGGCVRDLVLGRTPQDYDVTTDAVPEEIKRVFRHTVDTGIAHGTVTVLLNKEPFEVTTYRIDGTYEDGRHPSTVTFSKTLEEDLARRDFTINAMAYHPARGLVDLYGGLQDLEDGVIRCVGEPGERFLEDALRILRAYRFAAQLGFTIEPETRRAAVAAASDLTKISAERIRVELEKLLMSDHPGMLRTLREDGITKIVLPEFDQACGVEQHSYFHLYDVGEHTVRSVEAVAPDKILRLTMLLHDLGKPSCKVTLDDGPDAFRGHAEESARMAGVILRRLKYDNETIRKVTKLIAVHDLRPEPTEAAVRCAASRIGTDLFPLYLAVQRADADAKNPQAMERTYARIRAVEEIYHIVRERRDPLTIGELAISGEDLLSIGIPAGPAIGEALSGALLAVLEDPDKNTKETLIDVVKQMAE